MMGIKNLPWKKIGGIVFIIAAIITIVTNLNFVWNCLKFLWNLVVKISAPLSNSVVRDVLLFILIIGISAWLYLISGKLKKLLTDREKITDVNLEEEEPEEKKPEEDKDIPIVKKEHRWILFLIANARSSVSSSVLYEEFKKEFSGMTIVDFKSVVDELLEFELIRRSGSYTSGEFLYTTTPVGTALIKKILDTAREEMK
ncbi:MAG: hypothetical protein ACFFDN_47615 [Candidatus Hodarchaeota archaeon]